MVVDAEVGDRTWPAAAFRRADEPEDVLAVADPTATPIPFSASRLRAEAGAWALDAAVSVDETWHGAVVMSRQDGKILGLLLVGDDGARIALWPESPQG